MIDINDIGDHERDERIDRDRDRERQPEPNTRQSIEGYILYSELRGALVRYLDCHGRTNGTADVLFMLGAILRDL